MNQPKGKILSIGYVINSLPENWQFDCMGEVPAIIINASGSILYAGYSIQELKKISNGFWGNEVESNIEL